MLTLRAPGAFLCQRHSFSISRWTTNIPGRSFSALHAQRGRVLHELLGMIVPKTHSSRFHPVRQECAGPDSSRFSPAAGVDTKLVSRKRKDPRPR